MRRLILKTFQSPGDVVMLTAAVRELHTAHPGQFQTDVRTSAPDLWLNNPFLTPLDESGPGVEVIDMHYPLIHQSNQRPYHFLHGYPQYLQEQLGIEIPLTRFQGDIHLSAEEKAAPLPEGVPERFWIVVAGGKYDFTAKWWNPESFQAVVDHFQGTIPFVQCGEEGHWHPPLEGVVNLVGKTTLREFVRLMYHAEGVLCPVTLAMHLAAAVETKSGSRKHRPCVVVAGGREPVHWEAYPHHQFVSTVGTVDCCAHGGCWKSRCQLVGDGDDKDRRNVCQRPVQVDEKLRIPRCMDLITPEDVIRRIELYFHGGARTNGHTPQKGTTMPQTSEPIASHPPQTPEKKTQNVLIEFRHGLGDAVGLTAVLQHLKHYCPDWQVDVAALVGKHSVFEGLCRNVYVLGRQSPQRNRYDQFWNLEWPECATCYAIWPSTKVERCLLEVFRLAPIPALCRTKITPNERAFELARGYLEGICKVTPGEDGRYPVVLIHYQGNTSAREKDISHEIVGRLCEDIIEAGSVPVILDWDFRTPLADGVRIHNPHVDLEMWGATGTGDGAVLAALTEVSRLMVGIDSGPLHVASAMSTPAIGIWTGHHPLHYMGLNENVTHLVPEHHVRLLRGERSAGEEYFRQHYRYRTYRELEPQLRAMVRERLGDAQGGLVFTRNYWIRANNAEQDLVVVQDIAEEDSYEIDALPMRRPVVVDVGAHIGCFSKRLYERNPLARILAVECCPDNSAALEKNVGEFATVVPAALTYERDVALLNAVYPDCVSTGGSAVVSRGQLQQQVEAGQMAVKPGRDLPGEYWADFRPMKTLTLEELMEQEGLEEVDVLKLDCEGSEFSILENTTSLERIRLIVGEYHGKERFLELVQRRFADWDLRIIRDGELGTFWLKNPQPASEVRVRRPRLQLTTTRLLVTACQNTPEVSYHLLVLEDGKPTAEWRSPGGWLRGFVHHQGHIWSIDSTGQLWRIRVYDGWIDVAAISRSELAWEAHDLTVADGQLVTVSPPHNALVFYDPKQNRWTTRRPWLMPEEPAADHETNDLFHLNSVLADGDGFYLSLFSTRPKPSEKRWREMPLEEGLIVHWGPEGFAERPLAQGVYAPHSLRRHAGHVWWCDSFRHTVWRDDGWKSPDLQGFTRGLAFTEDEVIVGLSRSRVHPYPEGERCGICLLDPAVPSEAITYELDESFIEIYDILPLTDEMLN